MWQVEDDLPLSRLQSWAQDTQTFGELKSPGNTYRVSVSLESNLTQASSKIRKRKRPVGFSRVPRAVEMVYWGDCLLPFHRLSQQGVCSAAFLEAARQNSQQQGFDGISHSPRRVHIQPAMWQNQALHPPRKQSWQKGDWRYVHYTGSPLSALGFFHILAIQQYIDSCKCIFQYVAMSVYIE